MFSLDFALFINIKLEHKNISTRVAHLWKSKFSSEHKKQKPITDSKD